MVQTVLCAASIDFLPAMADGLCHPRFFTQCTSQENSWWFFQMRTTQVEKSIVSGGGGGGGGGDLYSLQIKTDEYREEIFIIIKSRSNGAVV